MNDKAKKIKVRIDELKKEIVKLTHEMQTACSHEGCELEPDYKKCHECGYYRLRSR